MNPGIEAVQQLAGMGYVPRVEGENIRLLYEGQGNPDPAAVSPLLDLVRQHKEDVHFFLRCHCPRCGGVATCPDYEGRPLCLKCDWKILIQLYPSLNENIREQGHE
jgi:hypothetical protein